MEQETCRRCRRPVLVGLSNGGRSLATDVVLDPESLDSVGELHAIHEGRRTWTMHSVGDVFARTMDIIRARPAGRTPRQSVHAEHRCTQGEGEA